MLDYTHIFTPTLLVELKAGYTYISNVSLPLNYGKSFGNAFGVVNSNVDIFTSALPNVAVTGYAPLGDSNSLPLFDRDNIFQYSGTATQVKGRHSIKYGATLIRRQIFNEQPTSGSGSFSFTTNPASTSVGTVTPLVNLLEGNVFQASRVVQLFPRYLRSWEPSFFVQDDWRATTKLTVNLGLRYDIITPDVDKFNHISHFDTASEDLPRRGTECLELGRRSHGLPLHRSASRFLRQCVTQERFCAAVLASSSSATTPAPQCRLPIRPTSAPIRRTRTRRRGPPRCRLPSQASTTNPQGALRGMQLSFSNSYVHQFNMNVQRDLGFRHGDDRRVCRRARACAAHLARSQPRSAGQHHAVPSPPHSGRSTRSFQASRTSTTSSRMASTTSIRCKPRS